MDLSIIIVNWNTRGLLKECLHSIYNHALDLDFEVIVVDNGSKDGSASMVAVDFLAVKLIEESENTGYVAANNKGINASSGEMVLLLNSDTEILNNSLKKMFRYMQANPEIGISGSKLLNPDKTLQMSVRRFPNLLSQILILTKLHNFFPSLMRGYLCLDFDYAKEQAVDQIQGAFMMINKKVIEDIGVLDRRIWSWFEDVDFCKRAKNAGWEIRYNPIAKIIHHKGQSFSQHLPVHKQKIFIKSLLYFFKKHHFILSYLILIPFAYLSIGLAFFVQIFKIKKINKQL